MSGKMFASLLASAVLFSACGNALAEGAAVETEFPEIVVSATVESAEAKKLPASV